MVDVFHGHWLAMKKRIVKMALMSHCSAKNKVSLQFGKIRATATKNKQNTHQQNECTNFMRFLPVRWWYDEELWSLKYSTEWYNITNVLEESQMCPGLQVLYFPIYKSNGCISQPHFLKLQVDILLICCVKPEFKILIYFVSLYCFIEKKNDWRTLFRSSFVKNLRNAMLYFQHKGILKNTETFEWCLGVFYANKNLKLRKKRP